MTSKLANPVIRELTSHQNVVITMTEVGITYKVKYKREKRFLRWDQIFAASILFEENLIPTEILKIATDKVLHEVGYKR